MRLSVFPVPAGSSCAVKGVGRPAADRRANRLSNKFHFVCADLNIGQLLRLHQVFESPGQATMLAGGAGEHAPVGLSKSPTPPV